MNTKRNILNKSFTLLFLTIIAYASIAQTPQEAIINNALQSGDAKTLSKYFSTTIDLSIPGSEGNFSAKQATILLTKFFKTNPVTGFSVKHRGNSTDESIYCICEYVTKTKSYRTYYLCKEKSGKAELVQLKFDKK